MDKKCTTIVCLVATVVVLGDLGFYGVILNSELLSRVFECCCVPMFVYPKRVKSHMRYKILLCGDVKNVKSFRIVTEGGRSYKLGKELLYPVQQDSGDHFLFLPDGNFAIVPEKEAKIKLK